MLIFTLKRLLSLGLSLIAASVVVFTVVEIIPGDPARLMLGINATQDAVDALRTQMGLDQGMVARYWIWVSGMVQGDFGISYTYRVPVAEMVQGRVWVSLPLAIYALLLSTAIAFPIGIIAASKRGSWADWMVMGGTQLGIAIPNFWFAMIMVNILALKYNLFSAGGFPGWDNPLLAIKSLTLPAFVLALPQAAILARVMRSSLLDTLSEDFMRTARAKGRTAKGAMFHHALRNAMIPVLTILGLQFSFLIAGAIIIERIFYLPGLGSMIFTAIKQQDLIVVESVVMLLVFAVILVTFIVDITYALVDPRLRRRT